MKVLITGGCGYIGAHVALLLLQQGWAVELLDNLSQGHAQVLPALKKITGQEALLHQGDVRDEALLNRILASGFDAVLHLAALKAVGESVRLPLDYYDHNVNGTLTLLRAMQRQGVKRLIFASSAAVYGQRATMPLREGDAGGETLSPYGSSKAVVERLLREYCASQPDFTAVALRYFNPIGAHESALLGEAVRGVPNNILPYLMDAVSGKRPPLQVFGQDYPTADGTCERDYVHVMDLAAAHLLALTQSRAGFSVYNLGSGHATSVWQLLQAFEGATGKAVPHVLAPRREGDVAVCYAAVDAIRQDWGWQARYSLNEALRSAWRWHQHAAY